MPFEHFFRNSKLSVAGASHISDDCKTDRIFGGMNQAGQRKEKDCKDADASHDKIISTFMEKRFSVES